jgi:hypothetical protein
VGQEIVSEKSRCCFVVEGPVPKQTLTEEDSLALMLWRICSFCQEKVSRGRKDEAYEGKRRMGTSRMEYVKKSGKDGHAKRVERNAKADVDVEGRATGRWVGHWHTGGCREEAKGTTSGMKIERDGKTKGRDSRMWTRFACWDGMKRWEGL